MTRTLNRVLGASVDFIAGKSYTLGVIHGGKVSCVECYAVIGPSTLNDSGKILLGSVVVNGDSLVVNDGRDNSFREYLFSRGIKTS